MRMERGPHTIAKRQTLDVNANTSLSSIPVSQVSMSMQCTVSMGLAVLSADVPSTSHCVVYSSSLPHSSSSSSSSSSS